MVDPESSPGKRVNQNDVNIGLLADSELLFNRNNRPSILNFLTQQKLLSAAYIGASNKDKSEFFGIFSAAMLSNHIYDCRRITSTFYRPEENILRTSDLIVLSGGNVAEGLKVLRQTGMDQIIFQRAKEGAAIIGISAGAIQLGLSGMGQSLILKRYLGLVPYVIDVHNEEDNWQNLRQKLETLDHHTQGIGLPSGSGMVWHSDNDYNVLNRPLIKFVYESGSLKEQLVTPAY